MTTRVRGWRQLFVRKSIAELRDESERSPLRRTLGRADLTILGIGAVIGSGIFVLPGIVAARVAGPAIVLSFLVAGSAAMLAALCYAEFASLTRVSGSAYTYAYATLGELCAWVIGWALLLEYTLGSAVLAIGWGAYSTAFIQRTFGLHVATTQTVHTVALLVVVLSTLILCAGVKTSAYATTVFVLIKVAVILLFVFFGMTFIEPSNWSPFIPPSQGLGKFGWTGIFRGASILFAAYIGFDAVTTAAQEARDPQRDVPAAVLTSLGISAVIYALVGLVLTGLMRYDALDLQNPVGEAIHITGVKWVSVAVELGAIAGLSSVLLVLLLGQARILMVMARDGLLPRPLSRVTARGVPLISTITTAAVVCVLTVTVPIDTMGYLVSIGTFFAFIIVCIGIPILRHTDPDLPRSFRVPGSPWVPLLGALSCISLVIALPWETWRTAGLWFLIGLVVYGAQLLRRNLWPGTRV